MQTVENVGRCTYKVQVSEQTQEIIETLGTLFDLEQEGVVQGMLKFAECMAVTKIINRIEKEKGKNGHF